MYSKMLLVVFIFITVFSGTVNGAKALYGEEIPVGNFLIMAIGITGIIAHFI